MDELARRTFAFPGVEERHLRAWDSRFVVAGALNLRPAISSVPPVRSRAFKSGIVSLEYAVEYEPA